MKLIVLALLMLAELILIAVLIGSARHNRRIR